MEEKCLIEVHVYVPLLSETEANFRHNILWYIPSTRKNGVKI